jgi:hypothetical protein
MQENINQENPRNLALMPCNSSNGRTVFLDGLVDEWLRANADVVGQQRHWLGTFRREPTLFFLQVASGEPVRSAVEALGA